MKKRTKKLERGITLIALVITIIILLIIAGVSISMLTGENGTIRITSETKEESLKAEALEDIKIKIMEAQINNHGKATLSNVVEILTTSQDEYKVITKTKTASLTIDSVTTNVDSADSILVTNRKYGKEIEVTKNLEISLTGTEGEASGGDGSDITVANAPDISGFNKNNTYYVTWNLSSSPYTISEGTTISGTAPSNWYDYTAGVNHWANVKTTGGGNDCYWVWIPRYAYKVPTRSSTAETIDIKFLKNASNIPVGEKVAITNTKPTPGTWVVHPAFWWDKDNDGVEDVGEQLTGIWVAKYEASSNSSSVVENPTAAQLALDGGSNTDTDLKVRVKPNVTSWRGITVNNIFTVCRNLTETGNSLENTSNLNSHMMKNTEWGACAYLSRSVYGKNGEVWNNPYYNNKTNYSPITGLCGNETNGKDNATTNMSNTVKYNEIGGGNASTTGNVYGVYDMAGGAWEYVAGYLSGVTANTNYATLASADSKYKDVYLGTSSDGSINYNANAGKYGDAVYETSSSGNSNTGSWDSSNAFFPDSNFPVFRRGGQACNGSNAGVLAFDYYTGDTYTSNSFRPVVLNTQL